MVNKLAHIFFVYNIASLAGDRLDELFDLSLAEWAKAKLLLSWTDLGTEFFLPKIILFQKNFGTKIIFDPKIFCTQKKIFAKNISLGTKLS